MNDGDNGKQAYEVDDRENHNLRNREVSRNNLLKNSQTEQAVSFLDGKQIISEETTNRSQDIYNDFEEDSSKKTVRVNFSKSTTPATAHSRLRRRKESKQGGRSRGFMSSSKNAGGPGGNARPRTTMFGSVLSRDPTPSAKREHILSMHSIQQVVKKTQMKREK